MREFEAYGVPFVVEALKKVLEAEGSDPLLAIDEQAGNVRRIRPMEVQSDAWTRSVYVVCCSLNAECPCADRGRKVSKPERQIPTPRRS